MAYYLYRLIDDNGSLIHFRAVLLFVFCFLLPIQASAVSYLPFCENWATVIWTFGPLGEARATAGGYSGVPFCLDVTGLQNITPIFYAVDPIQLTGLLSEKPQIDYYVSVQSSFQTAVNNGLLTGHVLTDAEYAQLSSLLSNSPLPPFDSAQASVLWWSGFSFVFILYITAYGVGVGIRLIRGKL